MLNKNGGPIWNARRTTHLRNSYQERHDYKETSLFCPDVWTFPRLYKHLTRGFILLNKFGSWNYAAIAFWISSIFLLQVDMKAVGTAIEYYRQLAQRSSTPTDEDQYKWENKLLRTSLSLSLSSCVCVCSWKLNRNVESVTITMHITQLLFWNQVLCFSFFQRFPSCLIYLLCPSKVRLHGSKIITLNSGIPYLLQLIFQCLLLLDKLTVLLLSHD